MKKKAVAVVGKPAGGNHGRAEGEKKPNEQSDNKFPVGARKGL